MSYLIHRCNTPEGPRYRLWSTVFEGYLCRAATRKEMERWLTEDGDSLVSAEERLARTDRQGSSSIRGTKRSMEAWDQERCHKCDDYHHDYVPREDGTCRGCGEGPDDRSHLPPCAPPEEPES